MFKFNKIRMLGHEFVEDKFLHRGNDGYQNRVNAGYVWHFDSSSKGQSDGCPQAQLDTYNYSSTSQNNIQDSVNLNVERANQECC